MKSDIQRLSQEVPVVNFDTLGGPGCYCMLQQLEAKLISIDAPVMHKLNKGITALPLNEHAILKDLPEDVVELYKWRNGTAITEEDMTANTSLFPGGIFLSLEDALNYYNEGAEHEFGWDKKFFPLFEHWGEFYLINCDYSEERGRIYYFHPGAVDHDPLISRYDSLNALISTVYESFSEGVFFYSNGLLEVNMESNPVRWLEIENRNNPLSDYSRILLEGARE